MHKLPDKLAYKHQWMLHDPEVRKRLDGANFRLDQNHLRKAIYSSAEVGYELSIKRLLQIAEDLQKLSTG